MGSSVDLLKKVFDAASAALEDLTGLPVLFDPQPVRTARPSLRLTYQGSDSGGVGAMVLKWQLSIVGAGDGPEVYLTSVVRASLALQSMYDKCRSKGWTDLDVAGVGIGVRMSFVTGLEVTGSFSQNEMKVVETGQWSYLWTEPKYLTICIPDSVWA